MFCKSCGNQIDIDSKFCSFCGAKQSTIHKPDISDFKTLEQPIQLPFETSLPTIPQEQEIKKPKKLEKNDIFEKKLLNGNFIESSLPVSDHLLDDILPFALFELRPKNVKYAVYFLIPGILNSIGGMVLGMVYNTITGITLLFTLIFTIYKAMVVGHIYYRNKRSRNIYFILAIIEFLGLFFLIPELKYWGLVRQILLGVIISFELVAIILLLSKTSTAWLNSNVRKKNNH